MSNYAKTEKRATRRWQRGFSLLEVMVSTAILLVVAGVVMGGMIEMTKTQGTISNRTEMHSAVRSATELLQQEVGQAGRISLPAAVTLSGAVLLTGSQTVGVSSAAGMFTGEQLVIDTGASQETVTLTAVDTTGNQITGLFNNTPHLIGAPVSVQGAFGSGIVPTTAANGSTGSVLKLYGDINGDGNMVYVEYTCNTDAGNLYRNVMPFTAATKPALTSAQILLSNIQPNPNGTACFTYQQKTIGPDTFVVDVAITLTVQTQAVDPQRGQYETETKALLNVAPRNLFEAWQLAALDAINRIQPMPASVQNLLP